MVRHHPFPAGQGVGHAPAGLFGYSHLLGGYAGGQAEYLRVPHADVGPIKIESDLSDEKVLFLSDILPIGYMAGGKCRDSIGRHRSRVGMRSGRTNGNSELVVTWCGARDCHRSKFRSDVKWHVPRGKAETINLKRRTCTSASIR